MWQIILNVEDVWENHGYIQQSMPFQSSGGLSSKSMDVEALVSFFLWMISNELIENLVFQTNLYAQQQKRYEVSKYKNILECKVSEQVSNKIIFLV